MTCLNEMLEKQELLIECLEKKVSEVYRKNSFTYRCVDIWNDLEKDIFKANIIPELKS